MRYVPYLYFLRIPLIFALILPILPLVGLWMGSGPNPMIGGFFDLNDPGVFFICLGAFLYGAALSVAATLVLLYGRERFFAAPLSAADLAPRHLWLLTFPKIAIPFIDFFAVCVLVLVGGVVEGVDATHWIERGLFALAALLVFAVALFIVAAAWHKTSSDRTTFIARRLTWTPFGYLQRTDPPPPPPSGNWPFVNPPVLLAGHGFAVLMLSVSILFYFAFAFGRYFYLHAIELGKVATPWLPLPTLGSVLVLLGMLCWFLSALAFLLDRYRIPILIPLAGVLVLTAQFPESDHYFEVRPLADPTEFSPVDALRPPPGVAPDSAIVVATSGGGIQAAAWTARVLTGLVVRGEQAGLHGRFSQSIRTISSVSGGSVGTLYFVNAYRDGKFDAGMADQVFDSAADSSLDDAAWGLVYPDMFRSVAPLLLSRRIDRGWALERAWLKHLAVPFDSSPSLGTWRTDARNHLRPGVIFNTTLVETGERFLFPTVDIQRSPGRRSFHDVSGYEALDLSAVTAARLSASFSYVTPVSRAQCCPPRPHRYHVADGGYYDNYGLGSISELLNQATRTTPPVHHILLIQILLERPSDDPPSAGSRGWFFQSFAPLETLYNMRSAAQYARDETEFELLQQTLAARCVQLDRVTFPYELPGNPNAKRPAPPLSWHLTPAQIADIQTIWTAYQRDNQAISRVLSFLRSPQTTSPPQEAKCQ
jgi:patatin-like phospholipase